MVMIHEITAGVGRYRRRRRKGRGESSGRGKTCGRGTKGSGARQGKPHWKPGHEGGQTPLHRRLPTRGFSNSPFAREWHIVNLGQLQRFEDGTVVDVPALIQAGLIPDGRLPVKILGNGQFSRKLTVQAHWYSRSAHRRIIDAGGSAQNAKGEEFRFPRPKAEPRAKSSVPTPESSKPQDQSKASAQTEQG